MSDMGGIGTRHTRQRWRSAKRAGWRLAVVFAVIAFAWVFLTTAALPLFWGIIVALLAALVCGWCGYQLGKEHEWRTF